MLAQMVDVRALGLERCTTGARYDRRAPRQAAVRLVKDAEASAEMGTNYNVVAVTSFREYVLWQSVGLLGLGWCHYWTAERLQATHFTLKWSSWPENRFLI